MKADNIAWSRNLFESLNDGGIWTVPRSGLIFRRRGATLVLDGRMPWSAEIPFPEAKLDEIQRADFLAIFAHMAAAGVPVFDSTGLVPAS